MFSELYEDYIETDILTIEVEEDGRVDIPKFHWARVQNQGEYLVKVNGHILYPMTYPANVDVQREILFPVIPFHTYKKDSIIIKSLPLPEKTKKIAADTVPAAHNALPSISIQFAPNVYTKLH